MRARDIPGGSPVRVLIRVRPGASRTVVGGVHGEGPDAALVVAVTARATGGAATEAALRALAAALGVPRRSVRLVFGTTRRDKLVEVDDAEGETVARLFALRGR